jgi:hypothetical protein
MLYKVFYGQASSMHHMDFTGVAASSAEDNLADMAPSWKFLKTALTGIGSWYRSVVIYDTLGNLGFKSRLEEGPGAVYLEACNAVQPD